MVQLEALFQLVGFSGDFKTNSFFKCNAHLKGGISNTFNFMWFLCLWSITNYSTKTNNVKNIDGGIKQLYILKNEFCIAQ